MKPYYEDDSVSLYQGRCEDILPGLSLSGSVHLLTDPPYFKVKDDAWDNQWGKAAEFLDWMGEWLDLVKPLLSADASVWVFASPELTSAVESVVAGRFRVLNSVRWVKEQGWHKKADLAAARSFLSPWEGIVFAEQPEDPTRNSVEQFYKAIHRESFGGIGRYLDDECKRAGTTLAAISVAVGYSSALGYRWAAGDKLPTAETYAAMRDLLAAAAGAGFLARAYADLQVDWARAFLDYSDRCAKVAQDRDALEEARRPFNVSERARSTDVWGFDNVDPYPGKHPCEKPSGLLTHMIETTTRPGDTIIDCFAGSGAVLDVARQLGRKAVGIEMDAHWCRQIEKRLSQQAFDFGEIA